MELAGDVERTGHALRGSGGRLLTAVVAWNPTTTEAFVESAVMSIRDAAVTALRTSGRSAETRRLAAIDAGDRDAFGRIAGEATVLADSADMADAHAEDALLALAETIGFLAEVEDRRGARAGLAGYCAAHGVGRACPDYDEGFAAERARQAAWLETRLGLERHA